MNFSKLKLPEFEVGELDRIGELDLIGELGLTGYSSLFAILVYLAKSIPDCA